MLAANQREQTLKLELLVQIAGPEPTAIASFNHHRDHFGATYGIELADGGTAHTACLGFGHERIVLALLRTHGLDTESWPDEVKRKLSGSMSMSKAIGAAQPVGHRPRRLPAGTRSTAMAAPTSRATATAT